MSSGTPPAPDYRGAAEQSAQASQQAVGQQTAANRPNQSSPFATRTWTQGPNGQWTDQTAFTGPLAGLNESLQQQAASAMGTPFSLSGLPELTSGEAAREQAINAAYGSATSRLDPSFQQREEATRTRLIQQGLQPGSEAFDQAMNSLGRERTDAYNQALSSAIGQGTAAGQALFGQSLASRQNALAEALRQRGQAFSELQGLQGLTGQQGFMGAGLGQTPDYLQAAGLGDQAAMQRAMLDQQFWSSIIGAGSQLAGTLGGAAIKACDRRAKQDIEYTGEMRDGVPLARWRYLPEFGDPAQVWEGVVAQDLQKVAPEHVHEGEDGILFVSPDFAPKVVS